MASWVLAHPPWHPLTRLRFRWDSLARIGGLTTRHFLNSPALSLDGDTPAMREIQAHPYPTSSPDPSLFEDRADEYLAISQAVEEHPALPHSKVQESNPCDVLRSLVYSHRFEDAEQVYDELVDMGVDIRPHRLYTIPAFRALSAHNISSQERLQSFAKWWHLVPPRHEAECRKGVGRVLLNLGRRDAVPDLPLIAAFAYLSASKGYASTVAMDAIRTIARYAPTDYTMRFIEDFCIRTWNYETSLDAYRESPKTVEKDLMGLRFRAWYSHAIRELASTGNLEAAVSALKLACTRQIYTNRGVYRYLLGKLSHKGEAAAVTVVSALYKAQFKEEITVTPSSEWIVTKIPVPAIGNISAMVLSARKWKIAIRNEEPLSAINVAQLLNVYLSARRFSLLRRIRKVAYSSGQTSLNIWTLAEMLYHRRHLKRFHFREGAYLSRFKQPHSFSHFLSTFAHHYHLVGVPKLMFDNLFVSGHRLVLPTSRGPLGRLSLLGQHPHMHRKIYPPYQHIYLVWSTVIRGAKHPATVVRLYRDFLRGLAESRNVSQYPLPPFVFPPTERPADVNADYLKPVPSVTSYDLRFFNIFISKFSGINKFKSYSTRVVLDIFGMGLTPDNRNQDTFVMTLTLPHSLQGVMRLLTFWEEKVDHFCARLPNRRPNRRPVGERPSASYNVQRPPSAEDLKRMKRLMLGFFHMATLRRLVLDGRRGDAVAVAKRFLEVTPSTRMRRSIARLFVANGMMPAGEFDSQLDRPLSLPAAKKTSERGRHRAYRRS